VTSDGQVFCVNLFGTNFRDCLQRIIAGDQLNCTLCCKYSVVQILLSVIEQMVLNVTYSYREKHRMGQQFVCMYLCVYVCIYVNTHVCTQAVRFFWGTQIQGTNSVEDRGQIERGSAGGSR
jgi:hypothetical protein